MTKRILVTGKVQGVSFRAHVRFHAKELGITGYARNLPTGHVEIIAQGNRIEELLRHIHKGSRASNVEDVRTWDIDDPETYESFEIR